jgi:hypothetical protein
VARLDRDGQADRRSQAIEGRYAKNPTFQRTTSRLSDS